jgi:hypothetical protein
METLIEKQVRGENPQHRLHTPDQICESKRLANPTSLLLHPLNNLPRRHNQSSWLLRSVILSESKQNVILSGVSRHARNAVEGPALVFAFAFSPRPEYFPNLWKSFADYFADSATLIIVRKSGPDASAFGPFIFLDPPESVIPRSCGAEKAKARRTHQYTRFLAHNHIINQHFTHKSAKFFSRRVTKTEGNLLPSSK